MSSKLCLAGDGLHRSPGSSLFLRWCAVVPEHVQLIEVGAKLIRSEHLVPNDGWTKEILGQDQGVGAKVCLGAVSMVPGHALAGTYPYPCPFP